MFFKYATILIPGDVPIKACRDHAQTVIGWAVTVEARIPVYKGTGKPTSHKAVWTFTHGNYGYYLEQSQESLLVITNPRIIKKRT
jgi:hypothetical protein